MAMNKKEQAEMDRLRSDLALARAMRWPSYPKPAPVTREWIDANLVDGGLKYGKPQRVARGWFINSYVSFVSAPHVTFGCSDGYNHDREGDTTAVQQMGCMYATKEEALQALRWEVTERVAAILAEKPVQISDYERGQRDTLNALLALNPKAAQRLHILQGGTEETFENQQGQLPFDVVFWVSEVAEQLGIQPVAS